VVAEHGFVIVGVDAKDRPGLLLDISKGLLRLNLTLRHSEASVVGDRSISIWRCEVIGEELPDLEEIWSVMNALLDAFDQGSNQAIKRGGVRVIRAVVTPASTLNGKTSGDVDFKNRYRAAVVAIQKGGRNVPLSGFEFGSGDVLILQTSNDSPLLKEPPPNFYKRNAADGGTGGSMSRNNSMSSFVQKITKTFSSASLDIPQSNAETSGLTDAPELQSNTFNAHQEDLPGGTGFFIGEVSGDYGDQQAQNLNGDKNKDGNQKVLDSLEAALNVGIPQVADEDIWKDLQVLFPDKGKRSDDGAPSREFLTAMEVAPKSQLAGRTVTETGLDKLPGVFLVSIDRPSGENQRQSPKHGIVTVMRNIQSVTSDGHSINGSEVASLRTIDPIFTTISPDTPLNEFDVLWFAGGAQSVGALRKIPGLLSYENEEVEKINEKVHDRRLVEAVIARRGPLAGKTVKQVRFRTRYGAAVIAVHRDGSRIHEHPGRIKLQAGDVLLLEAGPTFIKGSADNDRAFSLLAEVEDSAPPRLKLLIPALVITVAMLAVYVHSLKNTCPCCLFA
jgi:uncharacterized protein with PhoU and TrkA domain